MNDRTIILGVVISIILVTTIVVSPILQQQAAFGIERTAHNGKAPLAINGDNVYVAWWTNKTGNDEVLFRASTDKGQTFGDKINLSNTTDAESTRAEIDAGENNVAVTWWETNDTSDVPVMKVSNDNGKTFGPLLKLGANGTIGSGE